MCIRDRLTEVLLPVCNRDSGPPVKRLCPIVTLGVGKCCLGPRAPDVVRVWVVRVCVVGAFEDVCQVLIDMGTELGL
eukprot:9136981-Prorocentrum_lima.AAC.1